MPTTDAQILIFIAGDLTSEFPSFLTGMGYQMIPRPELGPWLRFTTSLPGIEA